MSTGSRFAFLFLGKPDDGHSRHTPCYTLAAPSEAEPVLDIRTTRTILSRVTPLGNLLTDLRPEGSREAEEGLR